MAVPPTVHSQRRRMGASLSPGVGKLRQALRQAQGLEQPRQCGGVETAAGTPKLGLAASAGSYRVPARTGLLGLRRLDAAFERAPRAWVTHLDADPRLRWPRRYGQRGFTLLEILIVVALLAIVMTLALPRIGHLPARLQAERCVSAIQAALDETGLRARATGRPFRLLLVADEESSRFQVSAEVSDPMALPLSGAATPTTVPSEPSATPADHDSGVVPGASEYVLPDAVKWAPESLQAGTASGDDGPALVFYGSGEAGGPPLEFVVGKRRYRLDVDRLTGRADIRLIKEP